MEFEEQIDWNNLLSFDDIHTNKNIASIILPQINHNHNNNESLSPPLSVDEIEHLLFNDDNGGDDLFNYDIDNGFFNDILVDSPPQPVEPGNSAGSAGGEVVDVSDDSENKNETVVNDDHNDDDDPLAKKRKRQLRNKDAALKSRERKKMYVKDLEMKSRYYEGECRRLGSLLQCVMAENQALRFSLHSTSNKAFNASMTKQESAVLFLESLLLGSLLWLMGIVCQLVVLPSMHWQSQLVTVVEEKLPNMALRKERSETSRQTLLLGKRFKASRSRMRLNMHSLQVVRNILAVF